MFLGRFLAEKWPRYTPKALFYVTFRIPWTIIGLKTFKVCKTIPIWIFMKIKRIVPREIVERGGIFEGLFHFRAGTNNCSIKHHARHIRPPGIASRCVQAQPEGLHTLDAAC